MISRGYGRSHSRRSLYGAYRRRFESWERSVGTEAGDTPLVFILVCSNTAVPKMVCD